MRADNFGDYRGTHRERSHYSRPHPAAVLPGGRCVTLKKLCQSGETLHLTVKGREGLLQAEKRRVGRIQVSLAAEHLELESSLMGFGGAKVSHTAFEAMSGAFHRFGIAGSNRFTHRLQLRGIFFQKQLGHLLQQFTIAANTLQRQSAIQYRNLIGYSH